MRPNERPSLWILHIRSFMRFSQPPLVSASTNCHLLELYTCRVVRQSSFVPVGTTAPGNRLGRESSALCAPLVKSHLTPTNPLRVVSYQSRPHILASTVQLKCTIPAISPTSEVGHYDPLGCLCRSCAGPHQYF